MYKYENANESHRCFWAFLLLAKTYKWERMGMQANWLACSHFQHGFGHVSTDEPVSDILPHSYTCCLFFLNISRFVESHFKYAMQV